MNVNVLALPHPRSRSLFCSRFARFFRSLFPGAFRCSRSLPRSRNADLTLNVAANRALCAHLHSGGVSSWLYGGNANFYNISSLEFESTMTALADIADEVGDENTLVIPSVGPDYGKMMDQAAVLAKMDRFRTAMVLPLDFPSTAEGAATGIRNFAKVFGKKVSTLAICRCL